MDPFRQRIENLLRQGKITPEEANKLIRALEPQGETTQEALTGSVPVAPPPQVKAVEPPPPPITPPPPPKPVAPPPVVEVKVTPPVPPVTSTSSHASLSGNISRLEISANSGDVMVRGVAGLTQIEAEVKNGTLETSHKDGVARIIAHGNLDDPTEIGWLNTVIKTIGRALPVQLEVRVPEQLANLEVRLLAGDLDVLNVQGMVELDLSAGDLTLEGASRFMVNAKAGDIKIKTKLENGESSVKALAGDVKVQILSGSSVALTASVKAGDVSAKGFILTQTEKRLTGGSLEGRLGAARAKLHCSLLAGDLDIVAVDGLSQ
jgi:Putative adhesin